jgi:Amt family ammonium transporter
MTTSFDPNHLDYIPLVPYNGTGATGGDSNTQDLNIWYEVRTTFI